MLFFLVNVTGLIIFYVGDLGGFRYEEKIRAAKHHTFPFDMCQRHIRMFMCSFNGWRLLHRTE